MRILTVPNWSFGRDKALLRQVRELLEAFGVEIHFCESDVDHNRTVTGFSGPAPQVFEALLAIASLILPSVDLHRHTGVHPRIGALDVCPFVQLDRSPNQELLWEVERIAELFAIRFDVPVYLYEKSEAGRHESDLPTLRKGGFGSLLEKRLNPDFGPVHPHPQWGATVIGVRDWLIALNVNLKTDDLSLAKGLAQRIRMEREEGDLLFLGVRALGLPLASREQVQISLNLTLPDLTPIDPILDWIGREVSAAGVAVADNELIGVMRAKDAEHATLLPYRPEQVVELG